MKKFFQSIGDALVGIRDWVVAFFAVDNKVNEDTVFAVVLLILAIWLFAQMAVGNQSVSIDMVYAALGSSLAALGIGGFKRPHE